MRLIIATIIATLIFSSCEQMKTTEKIEEDYSKYNVLIFLTDSCQVNSYYLPEVNRIAEQYKSEDELSFFAIYPSSELTSDEYMDLSGDTTVSFTRYYDQEMKLIDKYKVLVAPSAFIVDKQGKLLYGGAIDDKYASLTKPQIMASQRNLEDNLKALSSGSTLVYPSTPAVGCFIK